MKKQILFLSAFIILAYNANAQCAINAGNDVSIYCHDTAQLKAEPVWAEVSSTFGMLCMSFVDPDTGYASGWDGNVLKTTDGGNTWASQLPLGIEVYFNSIYFLDADTGFIVGDTGMSDDLILRTFDGGATWNYYPNSFCNALFSVYFTDEHTGYAAGLGGTIIKTTDCGNNWSPLTSGTSETLMAIYFTSADTGYIAGTGGTILKTTDAGISWAPLSVGAGSNCLYSLSFASASIGYAAGEGTSIYKTINGGNTWSALPVGNSDTRRCFFTDAQTGYIVSNQNHTISRTLDGGLTWTVQNATPLMEYTSLHFVNSNTGFASSMSGICKLDIPAIWVWSPATGLDNSAAVMPLASPTATTTYTITTTTSNGCTATDTVTAFVVPLDAPEICLVTVDSNNRNTLVWDKPVSSVIDTFFIYRETGITGMYEKIGAQPYADMSIFTDITSHPEVQSNKYMISCKDLCGIETSYGVPHKTMHLTINQGMGTTWNLIWESYEGFPVTTYRIYRGTDSVALTLIGTCPASNTQYSDFSAPGGIVYYQVEVVRSAPCNPTKSIQSSCSNIATNHPAGIGNEVHPFFFSIYPNPARDKFRISGLDNGFNTVYIFDNTGRLLFREVFSQLYCDIDISRFTEGLYFIRLENDERTVTKMLIKE